MGAQKNPLSETVLLSTHSIYFIQKNKEINVLLPPSNLEPYEPDHEQTNNVAVHHRKTLISVLGISSV